MTRIKIYTGRSDRDELIAILVNNGQKVHTEIIKSELAYDDKDYYVCFEPVKDVK